MMKFEYLDDPKSYVSLDLYMVGWHECRLVKGEKVSYLRMILGFPGLDPLKVPQSAWYS